MEELISIIRNKSHKLIPIPTGEKFKILKKQNNLTKPKVIIFDIYGTLFISTSGDISTPENSQIKNENLDEVVKNFKCNIPGYELPSLFFKEVKEEHKRLQNQGIKCPEVRVEELWARILNKDHEKDNNYLKSFSLDYELAVNPIYPMPGLSEILETIKAKGITIGIISNAQFFTPLLFEAFLDKSLEDLGFDNKLCFYSYIYRKGKPDTFLYQESVNELEKIGISPKDCLYIGNDIRNDILPASLLGFQTALFAGDKRSLRWREELPECHGITPNFILSSLQDIQTLL